MLCMLVLESGFILEEENLRSPSQTPWASHSDWLNYHNGFKIWLGEVRLTRILFSKLRATWNEEFPYWFLYLRKQLVSIDLVQKDVVAAYNSCRSPHLGSEYFPPSDSQSQTLWHCDMWEVTGADNNQEISAIKHNSDCLGLSRHAGQL